MTGLFTPMADWYLFTSQSIMAIFPTSITKWRSVEETISRVMTSSGALSALNYQNIVRFIIIVYLNGIGRGPHGRGVIGSYFRCCRRR